MMCSSRARSDAVDTKRLECRPGRSCFQTVSVRPVRADEVSYWVDRSGARPSSTTDRDLALRPTSYASRVRSTAVGRASGGLAVTVMTRASRRASDERRNASRAT